MCSLYSVAPAFNFIKLIYLADISCNILNIFIEFFKTVWLILLWAFQIEILGTDPLLKDHTLLSYLWGINDY